jgi:gas vesicle structural protein
MSAELARGSASLIDVLDRVLDKGIVIDAWMRVSLGGVSLVEIEARVVVASIDTYLTSARALTGLIMVAPPHLTEPVPPMRRRQFRNLRNQRRVA